MAAYPVAESSARGALRCAVQVGRARDGAGGGGPEAVTIARGTCRFHETWITGEAQVVVGAEVEDAATLDHDLGTVAAADHARRTQQVVGLELGEGACDGVLEPHGEAPACSGRRGSEATGVGDRFT